MAIHITGTGLFTPPHSISNDELVQSFNTFVQQYNDKFATEIANGQKEALAPSSAEFIYKASGIKSRYVLDKEGILDPAIMAPRLKERSNDEHSLQCEMALVAAHEAMEKANIHAKDIGAIYVACSNMQRPYPAVSIEIQAALEAENAYAMDINVACSSATFGIQTAYDAIQSGHIDTALVLNPEICSGHLNFCDRDSHFIFGDACTAIILQSDKVAKHPGFKVLGTKLLTKYSNNIRNNFGFMNRTAPESQGANDKLFTQQGRKVFREVVPMVAELIKSHLAENELSPQELKRLWLHQANLSMNQLISHKVLERDAKSDEAPVILDSYANTSSAGSIIAFHLHQSDLKPGDKGIICSFGAGYSAGNIILEKQ